MVSSLNSANAATNINAIRLFNATNAFKANASLAKQTENLEPYTTDGTDFNDDNGILKNQNVEEIKKFAQLVGENNLTEEDIKYGLSYGRSVIVEYLA